MLARRQDFLPWGLHTNRGRFDYTSADHLLSEMMNDSYFGVLLGSVQLQTGDLIYVIDGAMEEAILRVDGVYKDERRVQLSLREVHAFKPAMQTEAAAAPAAYTVRFRGNRGGKWSILDAEGKAVEKGYETRGEAERRLANILEQKAA